VSNAEEIVAAFDRVDALLVAATAAAPAVALLLDTAAANGIDEKTFAAHLRLNTTVLRWVMQWLQEKWVKIVRNKQLS
jgi:hypothetical protein